MNLCAHVSEERGSGEGEGSQALCACVSEERGNGEGAGSQALSLLSDVLRYINLGAIFRIGAGSLGKAFLITEKTRAREEARRCQCYEGQEAEA